MLTADVPLSVSDLIFSSASQQISRFQRESTRAKLSIKSRLHSIHHDACFVERVGRHCNLPLVANERCGSWYVKPQSKQGGVYFKSTDGHFGQWKCSLRRLNLNLFDLIAARGGCIIVDSTRRGKSMPDALSKTIPIWAAVWNRLLFPGRTDHCGLLTPPEVVGASEHAQIQERLDGLVKDLGSLNLDLASIRATLQKPLMPIWVTQRTDLPETTGDEYYYPVILCTASGRDAGQEASGFDYVQGAADDAEAWALDLTPSVFWQHRDALLNTTEDELPALIQALVAEDATAEVANPAVLIQPTSQIFVATNTSAESEDYQAMISCGPQPPSPPSLPLAVKQLHLALQPGKLGSRALRHLLEQVVVFLTPILTTSPTANILIACPTGKDHSIGVALVILCLFAADDGHLGVFSGDNSARMSKDFIKRRLSWIMASISDANPSRATLQSVNAFLLG